MEAIINTPATTTYLKDYRPSAFLIPEIVLDIDFRSEEDARVEAWLSVTRNPDSEASTELALDIDEVPVESVAIDGIAVAPVRWREDRRHLTVTGVPESFQLVTVSRLNPRANTKLMGIYTSGTGFFSLCEAEGFRRITPLLYRPDVMAR